jgi:cephalosporin-C deacetylase
LPLWDLPREELERYRPEVAEPADFNDFWAETLAETRGSELDLRMAPAETMLTAVRSWDVIFNGFGGHPIRAWLHVPAAAEPGARLPAVVQYQGYNGGRGLVHEHVLWALAGYVHLVMDTRGQGSGWTVGDTPDPVGSDPAQPGFMTRGIRDPRAHFYRRVFADAVRAVEAVRGHEAVDPDRVAVVGGSQGGGIGLAVSALAPGISALMCDVPFLCHITRGIEMAGTEPYSEVTRYLRVHREARDAVLGTLSYFDGVCFARRARPAALFSVGLMDPVCPPSTVYAAYNAYAGPKEIAVYPENEHEGGGRVHEARQLAWLRGMLGTQGDAGALPGV